MMEWFLPILIDLALGSVIFTAGFHWGWKVGNKQGEDRIFKEWKDWAQKRPDK